MPLGKKHGAPSPSDIEAAQDNRRKANKDITKNKSEDGSKQQSKEGGRRPRMIDEEEPGANDKKRDNQQRKPPIEMGSIDIEEKSGQDGDQAKKMRTNLMKGIKDAQNDPNTQKIIKQGAPVAMQAAKAGAPLGMQAIKAGAGPVSAMAHQRMSAGIGIGQKGVSGVESEEDSGEDEDEEEESEEDDNHTNNMRASGLHVAGDSQQRPRGVLKQREDTD